MASPFLRKHAKKPSFFKVLIEDFTTRLKIPPAFIKEFGEEVPKKTILETYSGDIEEVGVEKRGNKFYFHNGWEKFVEVNNLETGDFLVFKYFEDYSKFKVKIYGKSCCEKKYGVVNGKDIRNVQERRKRKWEEKEDNGNKDAESKSKAFERIIIYIDSDSSESNDDEQNEIGGIRKTEAETIKSKKNRKINTLPPDYSNQIQFPSNNPFFQLQLTYSTANSYVYIPTGFLSKHMEVLNKRIKFQISQEKWDVELLVPNRRCQTYHKIEARVTTEWKKIAKEYHHLKIGDVCIFEMIKTDDFDDCCVFRIHVYRWDSKKEEFAKKFSH